MTIVAGKDWIPLQLQLDIEAGSALDFSQMTSAGRARRQTRVAAGQLGRNLCVRRPARQSDIDSMV